MLGLDRGWRGGELGKEFLRQAITGMPVLEAHSAPGDRVNLSQPKLSFLSHNARGVVALEAKPGDVGPLVVVSLESHAYRLPRPPERDDTGCCRVFSVWPIVGNGHPPGRDRPLGSAGIPTALRMASQYEILDVTACETQARRLVQSVSGPLDCVRLLHGPYLITSSAQAHGNQ